MHAAAHFNKLECFCFNEYTLQPGESKQWPVVFYIDAEAAEGRDDDHPVVHLLRSRRQGADAADRRRCQACAGGKQAHVASVDGGRS